MGSRQADGGRRQASPPLLPHQPPQPPFTPYAYAYAYGYPPLAPVPHVPHLSFLALFIPEVEMPIHNNGMLRSASTIPKPTRQLQIVLIPRPG